MASRRFPSTDEWSTRLGLISVLLLFCAPLFVGLRGTDVRSDEAIYSYSVERILDTGDWLTPRSIPSDEAFLEKPPLKPWMVAGAMRLGLLPRDEFGLRFTDALFGSMAFVYVFLLGVRLASPVCGFVAVLTLFTLDPLVFDHGLRSNNMEGALFLSYCGGLWHFVNWADAAPGRQPRHHALAAAAYFVLGFMTKFVAALFLPVVWVAALAARPGGIARVRAGGWREWRLPVVLAFVFVAPWFIYESVIYGRMFWHTIFGEHVFKRFTTSLNPTHVQVWHYYFSETWRELGRVGVRILAAAGMLRLSVAAWRGESWLARAIWIWGTVPLVLMSIGTSKLIHYAYPFWPPVCLAGGFAFDRALRFVDRRLGASRPPSIGPAPRRSVSPWRRGAAIRAPLVALALMLLAMALWTRLVGPMRWDWGSTTVLSNSSIVRPAWFAAIVLCVAAYATTGPRLLAATALALVLPLAAYPDRVHRVGAIDRPLHATRDCVNAVRATGAAVGAGVLNASGNILLHSYYYYLWRTGPFVTASEFAPDDVLARITASGGQTPVIVRLTDYDALVARLPPLGVVRFEDDVVMLFPGPFQPCVAPVLAAGGKPLRPKS